MSLIHKSKIINKVSGTAILFILFTCQSFWANGQILKYLPLLKKIDSCCFDNLKVYPHLVHIELVKGDYKGSLSGWIEKETFDQYYGMEVTGQHFRLPKKMVDKITPFADNAEILAEITSPESGIFYCGKTLNQYYFVALWAYKTNNQPLAVEILSKTKENNLSNEAVQNELGYLYFHEILEFYSQERDYLRATALAEHLSGAAFKGFEYQGVASSLAKQLKRRSGDYKTLTLPNSVEWHDLREKMNRKEQLNYLLDRIHLLNCTQNGQPSNIYLDDEQTSISADSIRRLLGNFWGNRKKYPVINPYSEILQMKLNITEAEMLAPCLLDSDYIPTYGFHRTFKCSRNLYKYNVVIEDLIFRTTNTHFVDMQVFEKSDTKRKNEIVNTILEWCKKNSSLTEIQRLRITLSETTNCETFENALKICVENRDSTITDILPKRFGNFELCMQWPTQNGMIAKAMFDLSSGKESDKIVVKAWQEKTDDDWVRLWTALFLLKFDKGNYDSHIDSLGAVLNRCDGETYYPYAIKYLLQQNQPKTRQMAEGILKKERFFDMLAWKSNQEIIKLLLTYKSDATFSFISKGLNNFKEDKRRFANTREGQKIVILECDQFVLAIAEWRKDADPYKLEWPIKQREEYCHALSEWLKEQYSLIKAGKESAIKSSL